jgi:hypothetical protein
MITTNGGIMISSRKPKKLGEIFAPSSTTNLI